MRDYIKKMLHFVGLLEVVRGFVNGARGLSGRMPWVVRRRFGLIDRRILSEYMGTEGEKKLHVGCGPNIIHGWLNSDYRPSSDGVLHLDVTKPFPIAESVIDYIYSEHMIEHLTYEQALHMLRECRRVLKNGGRIRISTPDMAFLFNLYKTERSELEGQYIDWSTNTFIGYAPYADAVFVINNFVRSWGHKFIFDERVLRSTLEMVGFVDVVRVKLNDSSSAALRGLENIGRMPAGFLALESMIIEAKK